MTPYILNLLDLAFTLYALSHGGVELNPFMQCVPVMIIYKVFVVGALCGALHHFANFGNLAARRGLQICTAVYVLTNINHIVNLVVIGVIF